MPDIFDLETRFDELVHDVSRAAGPGDAGVPVGRARRRRTTGVIALASALVLGVAVTQLVGDDAQDASPPVVDRQGSISPGLERRERLLGLLPADSQQVSIVDVEGFTGEVGLDSAGAVDQELYGYLNSGVLALQVPPFPDLLLPHLMTYAGTGSTDVYLLEQSPEEVTSQILRAGWQERDGVLEPGPGVRRSDASAARHVRVTDEGGQALVAIAKDRGDLPDPGAPERAPVPVAAQLVELGGAVGISLDFGSICTMQALTLTSATEGLVLLGPPEGTAPGDVTVADLQAPEGISSIDAVSPEGDSVVAQVTIPGPRGPRELYGRLGLPGTEFC